MKNVFAGRFASLAALAARIVRIASFGLSSRLAGHVQVRRRLAQYRQELDVSLPDAEKAQYQAKLRGVRYA